jgi:tetratricopeptide (TPR) repeat protein
MNYLQVGRFEDGLSAAVRVREVGHSIGDPRLLTYAAFVTGWIQAMRGDWESSVESCEQSCKLSPDRVSGVYATGFLGYAHAERGEAGQAIPLLELAVQELGRFGFPQWHGMFTASLAEAYRLMGDVEKAQRLIQRGLEITRGARYSFGVGYGERILGRIALATNALDEAESQLTAARETFETMGADFEVARTRLELAELAGRRGNRERARSDLGLAQQTFARLHVPRYVERVERRARELG